MFCSTNEASSTSLDLPTSCCICHLQICLSPQPCKSCKRPPHHCSHPWSRPTLAAQSWKCWRVGVQLDPAASAASAASDAWKSRHALPYMDVQTLVLVLHGFSIAVLGCDGLKALNNLLHRRAGFQPSQAYLKPCSHWKASETWRK